MGNDWVWLGGRDSNPDSQIQSLTQVVSFTLDAYELVLFDWHFNELNIR